MITAILAATALSTSPAASPCEIERYLSSHSSRQTVNNLYNRRDWPVVLDGISSGNAQWIKIYSALRVAADGEAGESLEDAVYSALPKNPFVVLDAIHSVTGKEIEDICALSFESFDPKGGSNKYLRELKDSLTHAKGEKQRHVADMCLKSLNTSKID